MLAALVFLERWSLGAFYDRAVTSSTVGCDRPIDPEPCSESRSHSGRRALGVFLCVRQVHWIRVIGLDGDSRSIRMAER